MDTHTESAYSLMTKLNVMAFVLVFALSIASSINLITANATTDSYDDYHAHRDFALQLRDTGTLPPALSHRLYAYSVIAWGAITRDADLTYSGIWVSTLYFALGASVAYWLMRPSRPHVGRVIGVALVAWGMSLYMPFILYPDNINWYVFGNWYHNPTHMATRFLALLQIATASAIFKASPPGRFFILATALINLASLFAKPNFSLAFVPALTLMVVWVYGHKGAIQWRLFLFGIFLPSTLMLAWQYMTAYQAPSDDGQLAFHAGGVYAYGRPLYLGIVWAHLVSAIFPLSVLILHRRDALKDMGLSLAWLAFLIALMQSFSIVELGERLYHDNWGWGKQTAIFALFVFSLRYLLSYADEQASVQGWGRSMRQWRFYVPLALFFAHVVAGVIWLNAQ